VKKFSAAAAKELLHPPGKPAGVEDRREYRVV